MFLVQNVKKFLKQTILQPKTAEDEQEGLFQKMDKFERDCGLDPDDTSNDPAFHQLSGNSWHLAFGDD